MLKPIRILYLQPIGQMPLMYLYESGPTGRIACSNTAAHGVRGITKRCTTASLSQAGGKILAEPRKNVRFTVRLAGEPYHLKSA